jgi:hypothetical protein
MVESLRTMTDRQTAEEIIAEIFGPPPSDRDRELAQRVTLLQNYVLDLQETVERAIETVGQLRLRQRVR